MRIEKDSLAEASAKAGLSAGLTGSAVGGISRMLSGTRELAPILRSAAIIGGGLGSLAAAATALGVGLSGEPQGEPGAYTRKSLLGGMVAGGLAGAAGGGLLGAMGPKVLRAIPGYARAAQFARSELPVDNLIADALKRWMARPGGASSAKAAALLGGTMGTAGGAIGASEGMGLDYYNAELGRL